MVKSLEYLSQADSVDQRSDCMFSADLSYLHKSQMHYGCERYFNPLPNKKFLDWSKLKAFANKKLNLAEIQKFFG